MILVIDNYDSFTFNLVHYLLELGAEVEVVRNDALTAQQAIDSGAQGFLISPAPARRTKPGSALIWSARRRMRASPCLVCVWVIRPSDSISAARWCAAG
jgi:anthranilate/para-aminobenzoate synthase component II